MSKNSASGWWLPEEPVKVEAVNDRPFRLAQNSFVGVLFNTHDVLSMGFETINHNVCTYPSQK